MFNAALFTIGKTWKQPKCSSAKECMYSGIPLIHEKEWSNAIFSNMDGPKAFHIEWSKSHREREILYGITYKQNLKGNDKMNLQNRNRLTVLENKLMGAEGKGWGKG